MTFNERKERETQRYNALIHAKNVKNEEFYNGIYDRYQNEVLSRRHIPLEWRYDFNEAENPFFMERIMVNAAFNSGAVEFGGKIALAVRIEGADRKSYFAIAQSDSGIDNFTFGKYPVKLPKTDEIDTNVYDMRLTKHEDGCIYGLFCSEVKDYGADDTSTAIARCGIVRTKDLERWERLPNLDARFQQRNVVLHPEFVNGKYLLYTRPADGFVEVGGGGGIGCAFTDSMERAAVGEEIIIDKRIYHTIKESKNGAGAPPIKTKAGWLHIAHGVRDTAAGLRYVLYCFMTDLRDPAKVIYAPGGYFMAPLGRERVGDVSNVLFCNGAVKREDGTICIYYASSDTRLHVAVTTEDQMIDYCKNTPPDGYNTHESVDTVCALIDQNMTLL